MNAAAIHTAEILVRFANPPLDGKKPSIRSSDGTYFYVKPADFGRFQPGGRYRIDYTERQGKGQWSGNTYRDIIKCERVAASGDARAPSPGIRSEPGEGAISRAEAYFVTTCMAASISSMSVGRTQEDMVNRVKLLREVYREGFK